MAFDKIIKFTLQWEGGDKVTKDLTDPGGTTKYGIAQRYHPEINVEFMSLAEAMSIYYKSYWKPVAKEVDDNLDMAAFDTAVNVGVARVINWLASPEVKAFNDLIEKRKSFYYEKVKESPVKVKYLKGWLNRCDSLEKFIEA